MNIKDLGYETLEEIDKAKKEPYPLYYKEVFNNLLKEKKIKANPKLILENPTISDKFLDETVKTTEFIQKTNETIKENSKEFVEEIEVKDLNDEIKILVKNFENDLISKLNESNDKINSLQKELNEVYKELNIDSLTKAYSRKALNKDLKKLIEIGKERELNLALVVIDLDNFKQINDTYGHLVGDFVLIKVVQMIKNIIREEDKIYRFGGDEFILIFNRIDKNIIKIITEKIRKKIEATKLKYKDNIIKLTLSIGVTCHKKNDDVESILQRADKAVYESKKSKNKVTILC